MQTHNTGRTKKKARKGLWYSDLHKIGFDGETLLMLYATLGVQRTYKDDDGGGGVCGKGRGCNLSDTNSKKMRKQSSSV